MVKGSCHKCGEEVQYETANIGRREECPKCGSDLHVCKNCFHYDPKIYNECKEPQADRVLEKDKSNFCDYFRLTETSKNSDEADIKENTLKKLDDLFK
jgi:DNA-directed RNA polymerase subunit RPC12/RpoP